MYKYAPTTRQLIHNFIETLEETVITIKLRKFVVIYDEKKDNIVILKKYSWATDYKEIVISAKNINKTELTDILFAIVK